MRKKITKIGIFCKQNRPEPLEIVSKVIPWLRTRGIEALLNPNLALTFNTEGMDEPDIPKHSDMLVVLGGDGTLLSVARLAVGFDVPIMGVNLGGLGFMTEFSPDTIFADMQDVLAGKFKAEQRVMLTAKVISETTSEVATFSALNDLVVNKGAMARIFDIETYVDTLYVCTFKADGLIISTPTGSTAYSLSAGGPILLPTLQNIVITPICPHTLTNRPIVLADTSSIELVIKSKDSDVFLTIDGQAVHRLHRDDRVLINKSDKTITLIMPHDRDCFRTLREKLMWGKRS